uniref:CCHC-type domain-containing protein n=1 Tax=Cyprinus carpio TaxID=7962 RepID=A0A8C1WN32_CYPCA
MAALVGTVSPFDGETQLWEEYSEMLEFFFQANEITDADKKKAVLLSGVGAATYSLLRSLLCPMTPGENGETVADYVAELKKLAQHCEYGATLSQMLRDRLVCGVNDDRMQRRLLSEVDLNFEKALSICQAMESANKNVKDLQGMLSEETAQATRMLKGQTSVHRVYSPDKKGPKKDFVCYRCKGNHAPEECRFVNELCHKCGKRGHIKRACRSKRAGASSQKAPFKGHRVERKEKEKDRRSHLVKEEEVSDVEDASDINTIYSVSQNLPKVAPITQKLKVNGMEVEFEV